MSVSVVCARCAWTGEPEPADDGCPCCGETLPRRIAAIPVVPVTVTDPAVVRARRFARMLLVLLVLAVTGMTGMGGLAVHLDGVADQRQSLIAGLEARQAADAQTMALYVRRPTLRLESTSLTSLDSKGAQVTQVDTGLALGWSRHFHLAWAVTVENLSTDPYDGAFAVRLYRCSPGTRCMITSRDTTVRLPAGVHTVRGSINMTNGTMYPAGAYTLLVSTPDQVLLARPFLLR